MATLKIEDIQLATDCREITDSEAALVRGGHNFWYPPGYDLNKETGEYIKKELPNVYVWRQYYTVKKY